MIECEFVEVAVGGDGGEHQGGEREGTRQQAKGHGMSPRGGLVRSCPLLPLCTRRNRNPKTKRKAFEKSGRERRPRAARVRREPLGERVRDPRWRARSIAVYRSRTRCRPAKRAARLESI